MKTIKHCIIILMTSLLFCGIIIEKADAAGTDGDSMKNDPRFEEYAQLLITTGLNVQKGQELIISAPVEQYEFVRACSQKAYEAGAKDVTVIWGDSELTRQRYLNADNKVFDIFPDYIAEIKNGAAKNKSAYLSIVSDVPGSLDGTDTSRIDRYNKASAKAVGEFKKATDNKDIPWCIAAMPNSAWARLVFPDLDENAAADALWNAILKAVYVDGDGTSVSQWNKHLEDLFSRRSLMNSYEFKTLRYSNSLGTDFTVGLPDNHIWFGGKSSTPEGQDFVANMPHEEIFTAPDRLSGNGVICASKPLVLNDIIVNDLKITVKNGRITDVDASSGLDVVKNKLNLDEGASYLGEIALVPYDSPISKQDVIFYNTLFDENASCHFAFGSAYPFCIKDGTEMTDEELSEHGINCSGAHVDFMIGTEDLKITGITKDGKEVTVFENGNFAPEFSK